MAWANLTQHKPKWAQLVYIEAKEVVCSYKNKLV